MIGAIAVAALWTAAIAFVLWAAVITATLAIFIIGHENKIDASELDFSAPLAEDDDAMKMREAAIGSLVFRFERLEESGEVRETYYTRISEDAVRHHGCIQGRAILEDDESPRYTNIDLTGYEYRLINFPVRAITESVFWRHLLPVMVGSEEGFVKGARQQVKPFAGRVRVTCGECGKEIKSAVVDKNIITTEAHTCRGTHD